ncbi:hypothetical protein NUSPORA_02182 [Nucleospora cyclopteri]
MEPNNCKINNEEDNDLALYRYFRKEIKVPGKLNCTFLLLDSIQVGILSNNTQTRRAAFKLCRRVCRETKKYNNYFLKLTWYFIMDRKVWKEFDELAKILLPEIDENMICMLFLQGLLHEAAFVRDRYKQLYKYTKQKKPLYKLIELLNN